MCEYWLLVHCGPMALCASVEVVWLLGQNLGSQVLQLLDSENAVLQSQGSILWSSVATTQSESIFWVWLPVSFHLVSCITTTHRFPSMELHVEHFTCSCTKLHKMSKWLMRSFANMCSKARVLSPKHLDVLTLTYVHKCNESLPRSHDNHSAW